MTTTGPPAYPGLSEGGADAVPPPAYDAQAPAAYNPAAVQQTQPVVYQQQQPVQVQQTQPVVYQQAQPIPQQPQQQQVIYVNAQGQPIQPMQQQQAQPQVVYVNAQGQPIQPIQQTPSMAPPNVVTQTTVIQNNARIIDDDPSCLYIFAFFAIFIPLVGAIGMCVYNCGNGLGPKRTQAFRVLCICTLIGFIWVVAYSVS